MKKTYRYFKSQILDEEEEISEKEAHKKGHYIKCHFLDETLLRFEIMTPDGVHEVAYFGSTPINASLLETHIAEYGAVNFRIDTEPPYPLSKTSTSLRYWYTETGKHQSTVEIKYNSKGLIVEVEVKDPSGQFISREVSHYDETELNLLKIVNTLANGMEYISFDSEDFE